MTTPFKTVFAAFVGGAALWHWADRQQQRHRQRQQSKARAKPHELTTWEGEGGALRHSGPHIGPAPELP